MDPSDMRLVLERDLFAFARAILGLSRMRPDLHEPICGWFHDADTKPRKLLLLPRDHLKTSMMRALAIHMLIQPAQENVYFPGKPGSETRILYAGETATNAEHQLRWIQVQFESNARLRHLWPKACWTNPRRESKKWNEHEMLIPRSAAFPEASIETIGVGGAVTGRHYDVLIKDDLISLAAANSDIIMTEAIEWHKTSRALLDHPRISREYMIGTRWAAYDLYREIMDNDPSVDVIVRAAIEGGEPIFPSIFDLDSLDQLRQELGPLYFLLYMNSEADASLSDFSMEDVRRFTFAQRGGILEFDLDDRDTHLQKLLHRNVIGVESTRGQSLQAIMHSRDANPFAMRQRTRGMDDEDVGDTALSRHVSRSGWLQATHEEDPRQFRPGHGRDG